MIKHETEVPQNGRADTVPATSEGLDRTLERQFELLTSSDIAKRLEASTFLHRLAHDCFIHFSTEQLVQVVTNITSQSEPSEGNVRETLEKQRDQIIERVITSGAHADFPARILEVGLDVQIVNAPAREEALEEALTLPMMPTERIPPQRERLEDTRQSITHKFNISGHEGYITVGLYPDGRPGELFVTIGKAGSTLAGLVDTIGILTSVSLQYGVPLEALVEKLSHTRFEPFGWTQNPAIRNAKSIVDYIFQFLGNTFVEQRNSHGEEQVPVPENESHTEPKEHHNGREKLPV